MNCPKCSKQVPNGSVFCNHCGKKLTVQKKKSTKVRGNGMGSSYRRGNSWTAIVTIGWKLPDDPSKPKIPVRRTKGGFKTKKEAINYCPNLFLNGNNRKRMTMQELWNEWSEMYTPRVGKSTMDNYKYAYNHFSKLHGTYMDMISSNDLQDCMDDCKSGKRTHQNMKCIAGLLWGYAFDQNVIDKDITKNLFIGDGVSVQRDPVNEHEVKAIKECMGKIRYAEYVYSLSYLGFRPGEFLGLKKDMLHCEYIESEGNKIPVWFFVNGSKTPSGKDRIVIVPENILEIVLSRMFVPGTDYVFPMYCFNRKKEPELVCFKEMNHQYFNKHVFKPLMKTLGFSSTLVPYCCRHTYADMLKNAAGSDKDKASLIGHSKYLFTQNHYQSSALQDLKTIVDSFK